MARPAAGPGGLVRCAPLLVRVGDALQVLERLCRQHNITRIVSHEETGNAFDPQMAQRLKDHIYSVGGSVDPEVAYTSFRGRLPSPEAMLKKKGLAA